VPVGADAPHATDVAGEVALFDERAAVACNGTEVCQSATCLALCSAACSGGGAITKPNRSVGSSTFENEPT
jgi:hypothetical protein